MCAATNLAAQCAIPDLHQVVPNNVTYFLNSPYITAGKHLNVVV